MKKILCIVLSLAALLILTACAAEPIKVGGFSVASSSGYDSGHGNPHISTSINSHEVTGCDTMIMKKDADLGIDVAWYDGITFDEYREYLEDRSISSEDGSPDWFSDSAQTWANAEKRVANQGDITLKDGTQAFLLETETLTELGNPYSYKSKEAVFPTSDDSVGIVRFYAYSVEQWEVMNSLFGEVLGNLIID